MNLYQDDNDNRWFDSLDDIKPEYRAIKCWSLLQFFRLKGRTSTIIKDNLEPIPDLHYVVYTSAENRYYFREFRGYSVDELFFYNHNDASIANLQRFTEDLTVTLLMTPEQVNNTSDTLKRLWKANLTGDGQLDYKTYLEITEKILILEDYKDYGKHLIGFHTACNQMKLQIDELWKKASELKR